MVSSTPAGTRKRGRRTRKRVNDAAGGVFPSGPGFQQWLQAQKGIYAGGSVFAFLPWAISRWNLMSSLQQNNWDRAVVAAVQLGFPGDMMVGASTADYVVAETLYSIFDACPNE